MGTKLSAEFAIVLWLLVIVIFFFILRSHGIGWWASIVVAALLAWIILFFAYPFKRKCGSGAKCRVSDNRDCKDSEGQCGRGFLYDHCDWLFCLITIVTVVFVVVFVIQKALADRPHSSRGSSDSWGYSGSAKTEAHWNY